MNYMIIQNNEAPETAKFPPKIIQMFDDDEMLALAIFIRDNIDNNGDLDNDEGCKMAHRFLHLLGQWENQTQ